MTSGAQPPNSICTTVDAGNGSAKFVHFDAGGRAVASARLGYGDDFEVRARGAFTRAPRAVISCVAGGAVRATLERAASQVEVVVSEVEHGLDLAACRNVHTIGADRLWAARGATSLVGAPCVVIDVGTAVTVDAVGRSTSALAAFLGGAIAPGPELLRRALSVGAAQLFEVVLPEAQTKDVLASVPALGRESSEALRSGILHGLRGAVRELAARITSEAGIEGAPLVVTGGAAGYLLAEPTILAGARLEPLLVHLGLFAAWTEQRR